MITTYQGSCHCGFVQFEVDADIDHVRACDCSICRMRGALIFRVANEKMRLKTPLEALSLYQWGSRTARDYFCPKCGILPFRRPSAPSEEEIADGARRFDGWAINTRCLRGFDPGSLPTKAIDGGSIVIK